MKQGKDMVLLELGMNTGMFGYGPAFADIYFDKKSHISHSIVLCIIMNEQVWLSNLNKPTTFRNNIVSNLNTNPKPTAYP